MADPSKCSPAPTEHKKVTSNNEAELVAGFVAPGFEVVREVFADNIREGLEVGASFAVTRRGELIVDLWGGCADLAGSNAVQRNSLFNLWSTTKGLVATCIALLVDRRLLSYESPVAEYWPEFAQNGKHTVTVGQLMSHQAGVCGPREVVTIEDYYAHNRVAALLAAQRPFFEPGSAWGYHALAIGTLADELVRRVDGRPIGTFFAAEVASPLKLDIFIGLPAAEDHRQAEMIPPPASKEVFNIPDKLAHKAATGNPMLDANWPNSRRWRAAGIAGAGGSSSARSLAQLYGLLANDGKVGDTHFLSRETIMDATKERIACVDQVEGGFGRYAAGYALNNNGTMGPAQSSFGHGGWGGSMGFGDPVMGLGVGYAMNQMLDDDPKGIDPRLTRLVTATYAALEN